jgi:phenylacetic acid degradation protein
MSLRLPRTMTVTHKKRSARTIPPSNFYAFDGHVPRVHSSAFVHPNATVTGNVTIGKDVYIGPGAAIRGDWGGIVIFDGCNVQENCVIHSFPGVTVRLERNAHIGHGAIIHGAHIGENVLIGMNAVIMDNADIGAGSIVGALTFVPEEMKIPERKVIVGTPARILRDVTDEMLRWKSEGTRLYQSLPEACRASLRPVKPETKKKGRARKQRASFKTWKKTPRGK